MNFSSALGKIQYNKMEGILIKLSDEIHVKREQILFSGSANILYPYDPMNGSIDLPPEMQLRLQTLAGQGYKLAALRQVVDLTGAPVDAARDFIEMLVRQEKPASQTDQTASLIP